MHRPLREPFQRRQALCASCADEVFAEGVHPATPACGRLAERMRGETEDRPLGYAVVRMLPRRRSASLHIQASEGRARFRVAAARVRGCVEGFGETPRLR